MLTLNHPREPKTRPILRLADIMPVRVARPSAYRPQPAQFYGERSNKSQSPVQFAITNFYWTSLLCEDAASDRPGLPLSSIAALDSTLETAFASRILNRNFNRNEPISPKAWRLTREFLGAVSTHSELRQVEAFFQNLAASNLDGYRAGWAGAKGPFRQDYGVSVFDYLQAVYVGQLSSKGPGVRVAYLEGNDEEAHAALFCFWKDSLPRNDMTRHHCDEVQRDIFRALPAYTDIRLAELQKNSRLVTGVRRRLPQAYTG
jgi:hypothetical protein